VSWLTLYDLPILTYAPALCHYWRDYRTCWHPISRLLGEDLIEVAEYAKTMSAEDVDEVIDHILAEVNLSVSYHWPNDD
jgi:hypothetical protein